MASKVWVGGSEIRPIRGPKYRAKSTDRRAESGKASRYDAATEATVLMPGGSFDIEKFPALKRAVESARKAS